MSLIEWTDELSIGIKEIDEQHKKLANLANELSDSLNRDKTDLAIYKILDDLIAQTALHFLREETLMKKYNYPYFYVHIAEHEVLSLETSKIVRGYRLGDKKISENIVQLTNYWLTEHLTSEDKKMEKYLHSKGVT